VGANQFKVRENPAVKMLNARLTDRVALHGFDETLQQSLSGKSRRQKLLRPGDLPMSSPAASTVSVRKVLRRFRRNRRGSAAVEFALVAPAFFALLFAILETGIIFFAGQVLETVTQTSARTILTGQTQNAGLDLAHFKSQVICPANSLASVLFTCANVYVDVQSYPAFSSITINSQIDGTGTFVVPSNYSPGGPGQIVVVRLFYQWPQFVTGLGYNITNLAGNKRLLVATAAFQNEPF
jgi:Flp pilus assembly protein TadG